MTIRQRKKKQREKRKKRKERVEVDTIKFFLAFLRKSKILIFIKNNLKNIKNILTVRSNSI